MTAVQVAAVVEEVAKGPGAKHLISDEGSQFVAPFFQNAMGPLGILTKFGAIGKSGSIALLERLWRSLKGELRLRELKPLMQRDLEQRIRLGLHYYAHHRPHQGLGGATPAEIYYGQQPAHLTASSPPRARPGERPPEIPLEILYLDGYRSLPILVDKAAELNRVDSSSSSAFRPSPQHQNAFSHQGSLRAHRIHPLKPFP